MCFDVVCVVVDLCVCCGFVCVVEMCVFVCCVVCCVCCGLKWFEVCGKCFGMCVYDDGWDV